MHMTRAYLNAAIPASGTNIFVKLDETVSDILCEPESQPRYFLRLTVL